MQKQGQLLQREKVEVIYHGFPIDFYRQGFDQLPMLGKAQ